MDTLKPYYTLLPVKDVEKLISSPKGFALTDEQADRLRLANKILLFFLGLTEDKYVTAKELNLLSDKEESIWAIRGILDKFKKLGYIKSRSRQGFKKGNLTIKEVE
jgi:hypothetical protein